MKIQILLKLTFALCFFPLNLFGNNSIEQLSELRFEVEEKAQKLQQEIKFRKESEEVLLNKINEQKNKITREKVKALEIASEMNEFKRVSSTSSPHQGVRNFEILNTKAMKNFEDLKLRYPFTFNIDTQLSELRHFYNLGQFEAYQILLIQTIEKAIFDLVRSQISFETHKVENLVMNLEVLRLGGWIVFGKVSNQIWIYESKVGQWRRLDEGDTQSVLKLYTDFKKKQNNFISQEIINLKEKYL